jgi:hypothetical protein
MGCMESEVDRSAPDRCKQKGSVWGLSLDDCAELCEVCNLFYLFYTFSRFPFYPSCLLRVVQKRWTVEVCLKPTRACAWNWNTTKCRYEREENGRG